MIDQSQPSDNMWVIGYDISDDKNVSLGDLSYWANRHGSPLLSLPAAWVDVGRIPALECCSERADIYIGLLRGVKDPASKVILDEDEDLPGGKRLDSLSLKDFILTVEFTCHTNWGTNTTQRLRIVHDSVINGIPTAYAMPKSGIALRGISRRGDMAIESRNLKNALGPFCRPLVQRNVPVNAKNIEREMRKSDPSARIDLGKTALNKADPKVPLFCRTMQDSYEVPCATVQLDQVICPVPGAWKLSGCQLKELFRLMRECMDYAVVEGRAPDVKSGLFTRMNMMDEGVIAAAPPSEGGRNRNPEWDSYHMRNGFPNGSLGVLSKTPNRRSLTHNYSIHIPNIGKVFELNPRGGKKGTLGKWIKTVRNPSRRNNRFNQNSVPEALRSRELVVTYEVAEYTRNGGSDRSRNVDERTYSSKTVLVDMCAMRTSMKAGGRPRAMSTSPRDRRHLLAVSLPMKSCNLFEYYPSNARYSTFVDFADILVLEDGGYLGKIWWTKDNPPVRIF